VSIDHLEYTNMHSTNISSLYLQYLPTGKFGGVSFKTPLLGCTQK